MSSKPSGEEALQYLEKFLALIRPLPQEIKSSFHKVRTLDIQVNDQMKFIERASTAHCDAIAAKYKLKQSGGGGGGGGRRKKGPLSPASPDDTATAAAAASDSNSTDSAAVAVGTGGSGSSSELAGYDIDSVERSINQSQGEAMKLAEEKLRLTQSAYDSVDSYIRRLDTNLKKYEHTLRRGAMFEVGVAPIDKRRGEGSSTSASASGSGDSSGAAGGGGGGGKNKRSAAEDDEAHQLYRQLASELKAEVEKQSVAAVPGAAAASVDPAEPVYCICKKVSYGEMVACDNPECPTEWFHFACVGLEATPRGKWYCDSCKQTRTKKIKLK